MPVPVSLTRWFASTYPQVRFAEQWLEECHAYLQANFNLAAPSMLKKVEGQLLLSDLSVSTEHHAGLLPPNDGQTEILLQNIKGGVLVQVLEVLEIGRPALDLLKQHRERQEDKRVLQEQGRPVVRAQQLREGTVDGTGNENEDVDQQPAKGFPRAMLRLRLSDGFHEYSAIETKRIPDLSLEDTQLGCKILLKTVRCLRGVLTLDPTNCIVKGGSIPDLDADRDELLEVLLRSRIGNGLEEPENEEVEQQDLEMHQPDQRQPPQQQRNQQQQQQQQQRPRSEVTRRPASAEPVRVVPPPRAPPVRSSATGKPAAGPSNPSPQLKRDGQPQSHQQRGLASRSGRAQGAFLDLDEEEEEEEFDEDDLALIAEAEQQANSTRNGRQGSTNASDSQSVPLPLRLPARAARPPPGALLYETGPPIDLDSGSEEEDDEAEGSAARRPTRTNGRHRQGAGTGRGESSRSGNSRRGGQVEIIEID